MRLDHPIPPTPVGGVVNVAVAGIEVGDIPGSPLVELENADGLWRLTELLPVNDPFVITYPAVWVVEDRSMLIRGRFDHSRITVVGTPEPGGWVARWERVT